MSVCRVIKTRDFTIMSNHHLKNKNLSLKAKGLLSYMLSLPEDWNYTIGGLTVVCMEGRDAIREAVRSWSGRATSCVPASAMNRGGCAMRNIRSMRCRILCRISLRRRILNREKLHRRSLYRRILCRRIPDN